MPLPDFDPWAQSITLYKQDGTNFTIGVDTLDFYRLHGNRLAINYGTQVGASFMLLLVLLVISRAEKRKSFIFLINALCLTANTIRCTVFCTFVTSSLWNPYSQSSGDWSRISTSDLATRVAADVLTLLVATLVMISLCLQVWVVCVTTMPRQRYAIMAVTSSMACIALGYKAAAVIYDIKQLLVFQTMDPYKDLLSVSYIVQAISIWLFSCVFTYKLGYAINQRRRLKMRGFGPMHIVFIMGCQTMLIPAIFTSFQFRSDVPEFGTQVLTIVCIFLPFSAIWAGVVNDSSTAGSGPDSHQRLIHGEFYRSALSTTTSGDTSAHDKSRGMSVSTYTKGKEIESAAPTPSPRKKSHVNDDGIQVGHEFGISHHDAANHV
ncbi:pheromone alpha factor receptor [Neocucurbitaria cava]|uniref:Pheromone alpha factor receptor n=1 Tax=Neocucurbitaria cava TaxID=798079 RepID=A0A9W8YFC6_9PLEO|nr:pheromone alpha factor receptor [Neocucurbitaria cava]